MSRIFVIADTHFGDKGAIIAYEGRPFADEHEMREQIIANWNQEVGPEDAVYHLGDVASGLSFGALKDLLGRLNGRKYLVMGNHDRGLSVRQWMEAGFDEVYSLPVILDGFYILSHEPVYVNMASPYANVFGHVHSNPAYRDMSPCSFCACVERTGYRPVDFEAVKAGIRDALLTAR